MKKVLLCALLALPTVASAAPEIKQIDSAREKVATTADSTTTLGSEWIATTRTGSQCPLTVVEKIGNLAILDASNCRNVSELRVGQRLSKSVFATSSAATSPSTSGGKSSLRAQKWNRVREQLNGLSVGVLYSMADESEVRGAQGGTLVAEPVFGVAAEYKYTDKTVIRNMGVGFIGGLSYESSREYTKNKVSGQPIQTLAVKPDLSLWTFYANGVIDLTSRFSTFGGLNVSAPMANRTEGFDVKPGLGYQAGASFAITDQIAVDGIYRWINIKTDSDIIDNIDLNGFMGRARYTF